MDPSITDNFGEQCFGRGGQVVLYTNCSFGTWVPGRYGLYTEVAFVERLFCTQTVHLGLGFLAVMAFIQRWPLLRGCFVHKLFIWDLGAWPLWPLFGGGC